MRRRVRIAVVGLLAGLCGAALRAQSAKVPETYTLSEVNAYYGPKLNVQVSRDGDKALLDSSQSQDAGSNYSIATHTRTLFDLHSGTSYTIDLVNTTSPCGVNPFVGDWGDPFTFSAEMAGEIDPKNVTALPDDTVTGIKAKVSEFPDPHGDGKLRLWLDPAYGLILKLESFPLKGTPQTLIEVKQLSFDKPPASLFTVPPTCVQAAATPALASLSERIAAETGGNPDGYVDATLPAESKASCTVLFKVVKAGTLEPVTSGFQVAVDTQIDIARRATYTTGVDANGQVTYSGGNIRELTGQMQNGVLRIENAPPQFNIELAFAGARESSGPIYRQCFGPETTLLFVLSGPQDVPDGDWLWVKKQ